jgi:hypothetical protein
MQILESWHKITSQVLQYQSYLSIRSLDRVKKFYFDHNDRNFYVEKLVTW